MESRPKLPTGPPEVEERFDITDLAKQWRQIGWNIAGLHEKIHREEMERIRISKLISSMLVIYDDIKLSRRQTEVMESLCGQAMRTNKEIAANLNISERTAKFHISNLLLMYGVATRHALYMKYRYIRMIRPIGNGKDSELLTLEDTNAA